MVKFIKPCPLCKGEPKLNRENSGFTVACHFHTKPYAKEEDAIGEWNRFVERIRNANV